MTRELDWRMSVWAQLQSLSRATNVVRVTAGEVRHLGAYGGAQGVWSDAARTKSLHPHGFCISVLHTGRHYADDLTRNGIIYHYPATKRPAGRDASEIAALKASAEARLPIFVITQPSDKWRDIFLGWVEGWEDRSQIFSISFDNTFPAKLETEDTSDEEPFQLTRSSENTKTRKTKARPNQRVFKLRVFQRYGPRCPLSGVSVPQMLEAAHIMGHAEGGTDDPRNGIPLNVALHRAFDAHLFAFDPDTLEVVIRDGGPSLDDLGIRYPAGLKDLPRPPHRDALNWRHSEWSSR
ncbi:HNH endonuclease [[Actinomadura] parvosata]|uniref:HNH endonuclease n=1 Tax=[Actinomadura] parvosata TaxID=1955412 RepID=UPI001C91CB29|nr:HNH endonuclease signature motif containing protein [Nonomuraea sp. ATCC 55076]